MVWALGADHPSQWAAIEAIASTLGCTSETRRRSRVVTETRWGARRSLHPFRTAHRGARDGLSERQQAASDSRHSRPKGNVRKTASDRKLARLRPFPRTPVWESSRWGPFVWSAGSNPLRAGSCNWPPLHAHHVPLERGRGDALFVQPRHQPVEFLIGRRHGGSAAHFVWPPPVE